MTMIYLIVMLFGIFSFSRLQLDMYPDMDIPYIIVMTTYVGASPADVETLLSRPIEETAVSVTGVKNVMSTSKQNVSLTMLEFDWGYDMKQAEIDTRSKLDLVRDRLPDDASNPIVIAMDPSMQPILIFNLTGDVPSSEIRHIAEKKIQPKLERVEGISQVQIGGGELRQIHVRLNPQKLEAYKISASTIVGMVQAENAQSVGGYIETSGRDLNIQTQGKFVSGKEVGDILLGAGADDKGQMIPIRLRDVAEIEDTIEESRRFTEVNDRSSVLMIASKQSGANTVEAAAGLIKAIPDVVHAEGLEYNIVNDQSEFIKTSISNLEQTCVLAVVIVFFVLLMFFRSVTTSLIVATAIPISLLGTFGFMSGMGMTLNIVSLSGLSLAVGMLVDNAIVTLENIFRHREEGESAFHACVRGAKEIMMAITASTLTTIAVFLPILFVPGIAGMMFRDMSITIIGALSISLVVAITFVPMLSYYLLKSPKFDKTVSSNSGKEVDDLDSLDEEEKKSFMNRVRAGYEGFLRGAIRHRVLVTLGIVGLFVLSIIGFTKIPMEFMANADDSFLTVKIQTEMGDDVHSAYAIAKDVQGIIEKTIDPSERRMISIDVGSSDSGFAAIMSNGVNSATIRVPLVKPKFRERTINDLLDATRAALKDVPGLTYQVSGRGGPGGGGGGDIDLEIYNNDIQITRQITDRIRRYALTRPDIAEVKLSVEEQKPQIQIDYDREKMSELGLTTSQVSTLVTIFFRGVEASQYLDDGDEYDIVVRYDRSFRNDIHEVENMPIQTQTGAIVPLSTVAHVYENLAPTQIDRKNQARYQKVSLVLANTFTDPKTGEVVRKDLKRTIDEMSAYLDQEIVKDRNNEYHLVPDDHPPVEWYYNVTGMAENFMDSFKYLGVALAISIILVFMVMASQFESYREPFIVLFTIPLAIIGVVGIFVATGRTIDMTGFIGLIMLAGIVVNNGIVLVDAANQNRDKGMDKITAIVKAGRTRMRPVMMTALTTILSMVPLALKLGEGSEMWSGMGTSVIGGLTLSTLFTLFFVPVMYTFFASKNREVQLFEDEDDGRPRPAPDASNGTATGIPAAASDTASATIASITTLANDGDAKRPTVNARSEKSGLIGPPIEF